MANIKTKNKTSRWKKHSGHDGLWIQSRKVIYLYWYKFLQEAEKSDEYDVDWSRYEAWGGRETVMEVKFDKFWDENWKDLFAVNPETGTAPYPISSKSPKADGIRYALFAWQNRHLSTWEFAVWLKQNEMRKFDSLGRKKKHKGVGNHIVSADPNLNFDNRLVADGYGNKTESDYGARDNQELKKKIQRMVRGYLKNARRYLESVIDGQFP